MHPKPFFNFFLLLPAFSFLLDKAAFAQSENGGLKPYTAEFKDFSINNAEDKVSVTSNSPLLLQEAPGTVTVVTQDEIQRAGARDLMDVLRLVPGFEFYMDVQGVVGVASRGNSANEATLLLVDGIEINELLYGSNQFGNHFPIDQVRRIEIIRGPGSVMYGGFAVYAVINILTRASEVYEGVRIGQTLGETANAAARRSFSGSFGMMNKTSSLSASLSASEAIRSDRVYTDLAGNGYNMKDNSPIRSKQAVFHFITGNLFIKGLIDVYKTQNRDNQTLISSRPYPLNFSSYHLDIRYVLKPMSNISIVPFFNYRRQNPWETPNDVDSIDQDKVIVFKTIASRTLAGCNATWQAAPNLEFLFSGQMYQDYAHDYIPNDSSAPVKTYFCKSFLSQAIWKTRFVNLAAGLRYDYHSYYVPILSPRIAATRRLGKWHFKTSFNRSFRTPAMANISLSIEEKMKPQVTDYYEAEVGVAPVKDLQINLNYYHISARNGIVYSVLDDGFTEGYSNAGRMGTQGTEAEIRYSSHRFSVLGGYSYYTTKGMNRYCSYQVKGTDLNLALPAHKTTLQSNISITRKLRLNNTIIWLSDRYGYNGNEESPANINYGTVVQWNCFLQLKDLYLKGLNVGMGVYDVTNSRYSFIQSYNSGHMPLPAMSREFVLKIIYGVNLSR